VRVVRRSVAPSLSSRLNKEISSLLAEFWWASFFKDSISATRPTHTQKLASGDAIYKEGNHRFFNFLAVGTGQRDPPDHVATPDPWSKDCTAWTFG
jgi:hypothetical protein